MNKEQLLTTSVDLDLCKNMPDYNHSYELP